MSRHCTAPCRVACGDELRRKWQEAQDDIMNKLKVINALKSKNRKLDGQYVVCKRVHGTAVASGSLPVARLRGACTPLNVDTSSLHNGVHWRQQTPGREEVSAGKAEDSYAPQRRR